MSNMNDKDIKLLENKFSVEKEKISQIIGKIKLSKKNWDNIYTDFLTLNEQELIKYIGFQEDINISFQPEGEMERKIALISPFEGEEELKVKVIKIIGNFKFEKVNHRDYLGSILGLGIKREKIGDINVYEDGAEALVHEDVLDYIIFNLTKVRHTGVKTIEINLKDMRKSLENLKEKTINITSLRADAVISGVFNISRTKSSAFIKSGDVKVNNIITTDPSILIKDNSIITLRGYGKAKFGEVLSTTKKERLVVTVYKYI